MDNFIYVNACKTTVADDITHLQTTIRVSNPGRFPLSIPQGQVLVLTLHPDGLPSTQEIVHCTAISEANLTVVRGAQGTSAAPWPAGTVIGAYLTAEMLKQIADDVRGHAGSGGAAHAQASPTAAGFMSAADKGKLNGIQVGATNYQHPVTHSPTVIAQDANNRFVTDTEKANWNAAKNHADSPHAPANAQKNSDITKAEIEAKLTGQIGSHSHAIPVQVNPGAVAYYAMSTAPSGWLKANGAAVSRTAYSDLYAAIGTTFGAGDGSTTFNLPDLRGEFLRAWDDGRGVDSDRAFGSFQDHQFQDHQHRTASSGGSGGSATARRGEAAQTTPWIFTDYATTGNRGSETRPRNRALLACIKF